MNVLKNKRGAAAVELGVLLLFLMILLFGMIEFGFLWLQNHYIANSAREGARVAAQDFSTPAERTAAVTAAVTNYLEEFYPNSLFVDGFVSVAIDPAFTITGTEGVTLAATSVEVTVQTGDFRLPAIFSGLTGIDMPEELTESAVFPLNTQPPL